MNQVFLEKRSKEKINELLDAGMKSQEYHRNRGSEVNLIQSFGKLIHAALKAMLHSPIPEKKRIANSHQQP